MLISHCTLRRRRPLYQQILNAPFCQHAFGPHVLCMVDASHLCWKCFVHIPQTSKLQAHHTQCPSRYFEDNVDIWAPLLCRFLSQLQDCFQKKGIANLLQHSASLSYLPLKSVKPTPGDLFIMQQVDPGYTGAFVYHPPNCMACLLQCHILAGLLNELSADDNVHLW